MKKKAVKGPKGQLKKGAKRPKKQAPKPSFTVSVLGGSAILKRVRRGFQLQVSPTGEVDPQGGCVTVFTLRYPEPLPEDYKVWCEAGKCTQECHVRETYTDEKGDHDDDQGPADEKKPFRFQPDRKKKIVISSAGAMTKRNPDSGAKSSCSLLVPAAPSAPSVPSAAAGC